MHLVKQSNLHSASILNLFFLLCELSGNRSLFEKLTEEEMITFWAIISKQPMDQYDLLQRKWKYCYNLFMDTEL